jgi:PAS domain S-box-containing protein
MSSGNEHGQRLSLRVLDGPLPWHLVIDRSMRITHVGRSLSRLIPSINIGDDVCDALVIKHPMMKLESFEDINEILGRLIVAELSNKQLPLRGAFFALDDDCGVIFVASPLLKNPQDLHEHGILLSDFAPQETISDLLFAIQARDVSLEEVKEILAKQQQLGKSLAATLDSALDSIITFDINWKIIEFNAVATRVFGYDRIDAVGQSVIDLLIPNRSKGTFHDVLEHFKLNAEELASHHAREMLVCGSEGMVFPAEIVIVPHMSGSNQLYTATLRDITSQKIQQAQLDVAADAERLLHKELDHRVKNMLAQVVTLCRQTSRNAKLDKPIIDSLTERVIGFSRIHELLSTARLQQIDIEQVARVCLNPYFGDSSDRLVIHGPVTHISSRAALILAMMLNELATNASKYGAIQHDDGTIKFSWDFSAQEQVDVCKFIWRERHSGPLPEEASGGFGTQFLTMALSYELEGDTSLSIEEDGLLFTATIPMEHLAPQYERGDEAESNG